MENINIFDKDGIDKITYARFRNTYIPLINKNIICNSLYLDNDKNLMMNLYKKMVITLVKSINTKIFYKEIIKVTLDKKILNQLKKLENYAYSSIYIGMENISKRFTLQLFDKVGNTIGYAKVAKSNIYAKQICKEVDNLNYLNSLQLESAKIPKLILFDENNKMFIQSTEKDLKEDNGNISMKHIEFLSELYKKTNKSHNLEESEIYEHIVNIEEKINNEEIISLAKQLLKVINLKTIQYSYAHGDFYDPNIKNHKDTLFIYDFESSKQYPIYHDLFHYILNENLINKRKNKERLLKNVLINNNYIDEFEIRNKIDKNIRKDMLIIYLYEIIYEYAINLKLNPNEERVIINYIEALKILI